MAKRRVSAKQRLELIREHVQWVNDYAESPDDIEEFVRKVESALNDKLEPKQKEVNDGTAAA